MKQYWYVAGNKHDGFYIVNETGHELSKRVDESGLPKLQELVRENNAAQDDCLSPVEQRWQNELDEAAVSA